MLHSPKILTVLAQRQFAIFTAIAISLSANVVRAEVAAQTTPEYFEQSVRPLLKQYCFTCHSTEKHKGDFDMESVALANELKRHSKVWQSMGEQLANNEMPPKEKPQPATEEKARLSNWVTAILDEIAEEHAGDPGKVILRRLSNAEYTYTVQDLTGIPTLQPAREFPVDGAAGEGFMNTGQALVMSPSLITKYLDAGKEIASHAVLMPDGFIFSSKNTRRDWTAEILTQIRDFYKEFTDAKGGEKVNLQGIVFETNEGGRLPVEKYLAATLEERDALLAGTKTAEVVAREHGLNAKYFGSLFTMLAGKEPSLLLDGLRARWREAKPADAISLTAEIAGWQKALWKFSSVGQLGKLGGPKAWMEPMSPVTDKQELRFKIPASAEGKEITLYLVATDAGDGNKNDFVVWDTPRLVAPNRPNLLLRDVRQVSSDLAQRRKQLFANTAKCLAAASEVSATNPVSVEKLASQNNVDPADLTAWLDYLGLGRNASPKIDSYFTNKLPANPTYDFIKGWGSTETPSLHANSSDQHVRIPGNMKPHSVAVHPSPKLQAVVGWRSPIAATVRVSASVTHAHPECGNGVTWSLELRRGQSRQRLATGVAQGGNEIKVGPFDNLAIQPADLISILIGPRDGNHSCDLTAVDLVVTSAGPDSKTWSLAGDVSPNVLAGNPHADRFGNEGVWHFYTEPDKGSDLEPAIPAGSLLAKWQLASSQTEKQKLAEQLQELLTSGASLPKESPDAKLYQQLASLNGPFFGSARKTERITAIADQQDGRDANWGLDPALFGRHPNGSSIDAASLCVQAPSIIEIRLPVDLVGGSEFIATGTLHTPTGIEGSVQFQLLTNKPSLPKGLLAGSVTETQANGPWTSNNQRISHNLPIVTTSGSEARKRIESSFDDFRRYFPAALCYAKIVPVDEVITLTLFHREDDQLARLMLDDTQKARLDQLWDHLRYVSQDALTMVDAFEQLWQYATQDADPKVFEPLRKPIQDRAAGFRKRLIDTQPAHLQAVVDFARRAYRRPLAEAEQKELRDLYAKLRAQEVPHDDAIRLLLARLFVTPAFLYRSETTAPGKTQAPVNDWELASRLSYFLWSSMPDAELFRVAASGKLHDSTVLTAQTRRMLRDPRVRRLSIEFACQWLHIHDFDTLDEKSDRHFPTFTGLRGDMYEESILFFTDLFRQNGSVLNILDSDYTFLNESLAKHYEIPGITGNDWRRVEGIKRFGRGGILAQATTLSKQSGASRTSPILRGNWVAEALLGDKLPKPPKDVPRLPEDEATENLTVRQLTEKHSTDPRCYACHMRIDGFGFALESFDAIGRFRQNDLGGRPIDAKSKLMDGTQVDGIAGLREYLSTKKRDVFLRQFNRKLLGYSLGREVQLSDKPLLTEMLAQMQSNDYRIGTAVENIVKSRQFREIRGREMSNDD